MERNLWYLRRIPVIKEKFLVEMAFLLNNENKLSQMENRALIFSGTNDQIMPIFLGEKLNQLLKNSRLIITKGSHFNVFTQENLSDLDKFLSLR